MNSLSQVSAGTSVERALRPTIVAPSGTSSVTTALAPTRARWPTVIGPMICAPEPMMTLSSQRRVALAADAVGRVGAAERDALVDRHVVADLGGLADHREAVVDEQVAADLRARMDVDRGQPARGVVDHAGEEIELAIEQPVRRAVEADAPRRPDRAGFPQRERGAGSRARTESR